MYGTVCRFLIKPGMETQLDSFVREMEMTKIPGIRSELVYRMDSNPNEYYLAVVFDSEEAYKRNAASPEQDARYRRFRDLMSADPEWHDGTVVYASDEMPVR